MMEIPDSMKAELAAWNDGQGIDLDAWIGCTGNFSLAVGYAALFWPKFIEVDDFIFKAGVLNTDWQGYLNCKTATKLSIERTINHLHIADIQHTECEDISADKLILLGTLLKDIYESKLAHQFPGKPCIVEFYQPDNRQELEDYQLTFWQKKHEQ